MGVAISVPNSNNLVGIVNVNVNTSPTADSVTLYVDGTSSANSIGSKSSVPFAFSWDTRNISDGSHTLYALARYKNNIKTVSLPVMVRNVVSPPPPPPPPPPGIPVVISSPTISGTAQEGLILTTTNGTWTNNPTNYTYVWKRCDAAGANPVNISGATSQSYTLVTADVGSTIRVAVTAINTVGPSLASTSPQTAVVAAMPGSGVPVNTTVPVITGTLQAGYTLTVSDGVWNPPATSYGREWIRCNADGTSGCIDAFNNTGKTYVLTSADVGYTFTCWTWAYNANGGGEPVRSVVTGVVQAAPSPPPPPPPPPAPYNTTLPVITVVEGGSPTAGKTLSVNSGTWGGNPTSFSREWIRCDSAGANCTTVAPSPAITTYALTSADVGSTMSVWTAASNTYGTTYVRSAITAVVGAGSVTFAKYASPSGSDSNPGTLSAPYATFEKLANSLSPGQTGALRGGTYGTSSTWHQLTTSGSSGNPITIQGYPGETAIVKGWIDLTGNYVTLTKFSIDGSNNQSVGGACGTGALGIFVRGNNAIFDHLDIYQSISTLRGSAFGWGGPGPLGNNGIIRYCKIHDFGGCFHYDHGVYHGDGSNLEVHHNWFWNNSRGWGIQAYPAALNSRYHHNVFDACGHGFIISEEGTPGTCHDNLADYNVIVYSVGTTSETGGFTSGSGITGYRMSAGTNNRFNNNCCFGNPGGIGSATNISMTGNFIADPQFVNRTAHNYAVLSSSPLASWGLWDGT